MKITYRHDMNYCLFQKIKKNGRYVNVNVCYIFFIDHKFKLKDDFFIGCLIQGK